MISYNGKEMRNLEEQVQKNKEDIAKHYQAIALPLNLSGIEVVGSINDPSELANITGKFYGEAYVQVVNDNTILWIWSRANPDAGQPSDYWLDIPFTTVGAQGNTPQLRLDEDGDLSVSYDNGIDWNELGNIKGPIGENTRFYSSTLTPSGPANPYGDPFKPGDQWIHTLTGDLYQYSITAVGNSAWNKTGNIRGPQGRQGNTGPQGPQGFQGEPGLQGPAGQPGHTVNILGKLTGVDQLGSPYNVDKNDAYLVANGEKYDLWIIGGTDSSREWINAGVFAAGSSLTYNGEPISTFDITNVIFKTKLTDTTFRTGYPYVSSTGATNWKTPVSYFTGLPNNTDVVARHSLSGGLQCLVNSEEALNYVKSADVSKARPQTGFSYGLPDTFATPRAYVDALVARSKAKVECQIVKRGNSLTLERDRMYLIRAYGQNTATLKDNQGNTIAPDFTMAFGAISSSNIEISDPKKTWAGFMYISNTSSMIPNISWNGNSSEKVIIYNNDKGTTGSGNLYVYSIG